MLVEYYNKKKFEKTTYYQDTKNGYWKTKFDLGKFGEYKIYKELRSLEQQGAKFLFNTYIPKADGTTSEIDVMMLCSYGLFVFESKNYSGWIFGSENQKKWTQTLPQGRGRSHKEYFYNPIMQNKNHIKYLTEYLNTNIPMWSVIAFSERCTLKKIDVISPDIYVVNRNNIFWVVRNIVKNGEKKLTDEECVKIYESLYPLTQVTDSIKEQHIENIKNVFK